MTTIRVVPKTHWFNGWFLRLFSRAVICLDGKEHPGQWGTPTDVTVKPGKHKVSVGARYRGTRALLGLAPTQITVEQDHQVVVEARNGFFNHQPFEVTHLP